MLPTYREDKCRQNHVSRRITMALLCYSALFMTRAFSEDVNSSHNVDIGQLFSAINRVMVPDGVDPINVKTMGAILKQHQDINLRGKTILLMNQKMDSGLVPIISLEILSDVLADARSCLEVLILHDDKHKRTVIISARGVYELDKQELFLSQYSESELSKEGFDALMSDVVAPSSDIGVTAANDKAPTSYPMLWFVSIWKDPSAKPSVAAFSEMPYENLLNQDLNAWYKPAYYPSWAVKLLRIIHSETINIL